MKKISLFSLIVSALLFTACGEKVKDEAKAVTNTVSEATASTVDAAKDKAAETSKIAKEKAAVLAAEAKELAVKAAKEAEELAVKIAAEAKEKAEAAAKIAKAKTEEITEIVKKKVAEVTTPAIDTAKGATLYAKCAGCHGKDGKTKALGKSVVIAGQDISTLSASMKEYKAGTRNVNGMGTLMKAQIKDTSDADIDALAAYMATLK